jgi:hypothetical protein
MSISSQIFEWEGITQPSYWGGKSPLAMARRL